MVLKYRPVLLGYVSSRSLLQWLTPTSNDPVHLGEAWEFARYQNAAELSAKRIKRSRQQGKLIIAKPADCGPSRRPGTIEKADATSTPAGMRRIAGGCAGGATNLSTEKARKLSSERSPTCRKCGRVGAILKGLCPACRINYRNY